MTPLHQTKIENKRLLSVERINQYISEEDQSEIQYDIFHPKQIRKTTLSGYKKAIDEIAYSNTTSILNEVRERLPENLNCYAALKNKLNAFAKKDFFTSQDYMALQDAIDFKTIMRSSQKMTLDKQEEISLFNDVWLEGLYLHCCLQMDRLLIQGIIFKASGDQTMVLHPVKEADCKIRAHEYAAIQLIGVCEAEQSIPCILAIAHELERIASDKPELSKTLHGIRYAITILTDANIKLYTPLNKIVAVLGALKKTMANDLEKLVKELETCEIEASIIPHLRELVAWLDGLYTHTYNPPERSFFARGVEKAKETAFKSATNFSKKDVANYYHRAAEVLRHSIERYELEINKTQGEKPATVEAIQPTPEAFDHMSSEINKDTEIPDANSGNQSITNATDTTGTKYVFECSPQMRVIIQDPGHHLSSAQFERLKKEWASSLSTVLAGEKIKRDASTGTESLSLNHQTTLFSRPVSPVNAETSFWRLLNEVKDCTDAIKIDALYNALQRPESLSDAQNERLHFLKDRAITTFKSYKNDTYLKDYLGPISAYIFPRANHKIANNALTKFTQQGVVETTDAKTFLLELFNARSQLSSKKQSHTLLPAIDKLLLEAYVHLLNKSPNHKHDEALTMSK